jgi:hypothetical protein
LPQASHTQSKPIEPDKGDPFGGDEDRRYIVGNLAKGDDGRLIKFVDSDPAARIDGANPNEFEPFADLVNRLLQHLVAFLDMDLASPERRATAMAVGLYYSAPVQPESIVDYSLRPPAGGIHNPVWWNCGFYDEPIPDEHAVHDLEHGVVWLAYSPDLDAADIEVIHELARNDDRVLAAPYPDLAADEAVVATAWARQLRLDAVDDSRLAEFVAQYQDGSQAPEAGASCSGTPFGEPIP